MALASRNVLLFFGTALQICLRYVQASQIAAFINAGYDAPQVVMYDSASESILYSLCNSYETPVFPANKSAAFELMPEFPPLPGTHVSVIGYADNNGTIMTQVFYQTKERNHIVEATFACDRNTGHYTPSRGQTGYAWALTDTNDIKTPKEGTDLVALLVGEEGGIRVQYKDKGNTLSSIKYKPKERAGWFNSGLSVPWDSVGNLAAGFAVTDKLTVVAPEAGRADEAANLFISTTISDKEGVWGIDAVPYGIHAYNGSDPTKLLPVQSNMSQNDFGFGYNDGGPKFTLDGFDVAVTPFDLAFGSRETMSILYVGKDKQLRQVRREENEDRSFKWSNATRPSAAAWPLADDPSAHLGVAYNVQADRIWVYYMSNKTMMQMYQPRGGQWKDAVALPKFNATAAAGDQSQSGSGGLSKGGKLGVGIGVGLGVPVLLALIAAYVFYHSRKSRRNRDAENAALRDAHAAAVAPPSHPGSPAPRYTSGYWQPAPGQQPHDGPWPQHQPGVPYSDQNGYIKPESGYGWGNGAPGDQKLQQQQQYHYSGPMPPHQSPPSQTQPVFEMGNNQVVPPPQEMSGEATMVNDMPSPHPK